MVRIGCHQRGSRNIEPVVDAWTRLNVELFVDRVYDPFVLAWLKVGILETLQASQPESELDLCNSGTFAAATVRHALSIQSKACLLEEGIRTQPKGMQPPKTQHLCPIDNATARVA